MNSMWELWKSLKSLNDFENQEKNREYDDQYNKINNIPEEDIDITENFMRPSMVGGKSKKKSRKSKRK